MNLTAFLIVQISQSLRERGVSFESNQLQLALSLRVQRNHSLESVIGGALAELLLPAGFEVGFTNDLIEAVMRTVLIACLERALLLTP